MHHKGEPQTVEKKENKGECLFLLCLGGVWMEEGLNDKKEGYSIQEREREKREGYSIEERKKREKALLFPHHILAPNLKQCAQNETCMTPGYVGLEARKDEGSSTRTTRGLWPLQRKIERVYLLTCSLSLPALWANLGLHLMSGKEGIN